MSQVTRILFGGAVVCMFAGCSESSNSVDTSLQVDDAAIKKSLPDQALGDLSPDQAVADQGQAHGTLGPYAQCNKPEECQVGLTCAKPRKDSKWGQCTKSCDPQNNNDACPAPLSSDQQVACYPPLKICTIVCGQYAGDCPDWLECLSHEVCLEPVNTKPTKGVGEACTDQSQCKEAMECIGYQSRPTDYCLPHCNTDEECSKAAPGSEGRCFGVQNTLKYCQYLCPPFVKSGICPGELKCTFGMCL